MYIYNRVDLILQRQSDDRSKCIEDPEDARRRRRRLRFIERTATAEALVCDGYSDFIPLRSSQCGTVNPILQLWNLFINLTKFLTVYIDYCVKIYKILKVKKKIFIILITRLFA